MRILAAMSGGVDSAVTAHLLKKQGHCVEGATLVLCHSSKESGEDARAVAEAIGIPFAAYDFCQSFTEEVIEDFVSTYERGATPNPCVVCNKRVKFKRMLELAENGGFQSIATGHYANIELDSATGRYLLKRAVDPKKDQSYVLYGLSQYQLGHTLFPLGQFTKEQIREIAGEIELPNAHRKDSQDICFIPDGDYGAFIEGYRGKSFDSGDFVKQDGTVLGQHRGIIRYTIGQRKGLGLALPHPMFVLRKDVENNRVVLCDHEELFTSRVRADRINLIPFERIDGSLRVRAKLRYKQPEQWATVVQDGEDSLVLDFDEPQRAVAAGQSLVMYDGDYVVGGGIIL